MLPHTTANPSQGDRQIALTAFAATCAPHEISQADPDVTPMNIFSKYRCDVCSILITSHFVATLERILAQAQLPFRAMKKLKAG
jgi:nitrous oxide reductase accessory protein NosL